VGACEHVGVCASFLVATALRGGCVTNAEDGVGGSAKPKFCAFHADGALQALCQRATILLRHC